MADINHVIEATGDLPEFTKRYMNLLKNHSDVLTPFLNSVFKSESTNIFEFMYSVFKAKSKEPWSLKMFYVTIMNLSMTIGDRGTREFYNYMLLSEPPGNISPIYDIVKLNIDNETESMFKEMWNSLNPIEPFADAPSSAGTVSRGISHRDKRIYGMLLLCIIILVCCGIYFGVKRTGARQVMLEV